MLLNVFMLVWKNFQSHFVYKLLLMLRESLRHLYQVHIKPFDKTSKIAAIEFHSSSYCHISTGMLLAGDITKP